MLISAGCGVGASVEKGGDEFFSEVLSPSLKGTVKCSLPSSFRNSHDSSQASNVLIGSSFGGCLQHQKAFL